MIKMGLESEGIEVVLQAKNDIEAPNSFIQNLELYVFEKDKNKSIELLSKFKRQRNPQ